MRKILFVSLVLCASPLFALPNAFVYLREVDPTILQDIRYAGSHNFVGRPIRGYEKKECILTAQTAIRLSIVQKKLRMQGLSLKVYDCYRPEMAVEDFLDWSKKPDAQKMKTEFFPHINKTDIFKLGYVAKQSAHSRGSTVDLTLVSLDSGDNGIDMGTGYDYLDQKASILYSHFPRIVLENRMRLRKIMKAYGFIPYDKEWWHFTIKNETFPHHSFNFKVR